MKSLHALVLIICITFTPIIAQCAEPHRSIRVTGTAEQTIAPDHSKIHAQLRIVSSSADESYQRVSEQVIHLANQLQTLGLQKEDMTVSAISQGADYEWRNNTRILKGYYSSCSLTIMVRVIEDTYKIHSELSKNSLLTVNATEYGRTDEEALKTSALQKALTNAAAKAEAMAQTLGAQLGEVITIQESGLGSIPVQRESMRMMQSADMGEVTQTGSLTIRGEVIVEFALK